MDWQAIETAPVGEDILLFAVNAEDAIVIAHRFPGDDDPECWYPQHEAVFRGDPYIGLNPTHWMPLPSFPSPAAREAQATESVSLVNDGESTT